MALQVAITSPLTTKLTSWRFRYGFWCPSLCSVCIVLLACVAIDSQPGLFSPLLQTLMNVRKAPTPVMTPHSCAVMTSAPTTATASTALNRKSLTMTASLAEVSTSNGNWQLTWCQLCRHWWHRMFSLSSQPVVPSMTIKFASWRLPFFAGRLFHHTQFDICNRVKEKYKT